MTVGLAALLLAAPVERADVTAGLAAADRLEAQHAYDAARRQLAGLLPLLVGDEKDAATLRVCALYALEARPAEAQRCYGDAKFVGDDSRALARYHAAVLALEAGEAGGRDALEDLLVEAPGTEGARRALQWLRGSARAERGPAAEADLLLGIVSRLENAKGPNARDLYSEALVEAARIRLTERHDAASAERLLARAETAAGIGHWADDAMFWHAKALRALSKHAEALALLRRLVDERESSWFVGSYDSVFYDDALLELGDTLAALGRTKEAIKAYRALADRAPTSRLIDDALARAAHLEKP